jgi:hypothetical protein
VEALDPLIIRDYDLAHPQPGLDVLRVGVQDLGQQELAGFSVARLNGLDSAL